MMSCTRWSRRAWVACLGTVCVLFPIFSFASAKPYPSNDPVAQAARAELAARFAWADESWSGDDGPYRRIRDEIDCLVTTGQKPEALALTYGVQARTRRSDPEAVFRWAYAAYVAASVPHLSVAEKYQRLGLSVSTMARPASPHSYQYDRIRYLLEVFISPVGDYHLIQMGERLLQREPNNREFFYDYVKNLSDGGDAWDRPYSRVHADLQKALSLAKTDLQAHPNDARLYRLIGDVYYAQWRHDNAQANAQSATQAYRRYLQLTTEPDNRTHAERSLVALQHGQVRWKDGSYVLRDLLPQKPER